MRQVKIFLSRTGSFMLLAFISYLHRWVFGLFGVKAPFSSKVVAQNPGKNNLGNTIIKLIK